MPKKRRTDKAPKPDRWQTATAIGSLLSVVLVAVNLVLTYRTGRNQQDLTRRDQAAKRYSQAITQLGQEDTDPDNKLSVRIGAVRALGALMRDAPELHDDIVAQLCAFVQTHATGKPVKDARGAWLPSSLDVRTAVEVIAERPERRETVRLVTAGTHLSLPAADLERGRLAGANLDGIILAKARLTGAHLDGAGLRFANLRNADLRAAGLAGADLHAADLTGADLAHADLRGARLASAILTGATLTCARVDAATTLPPAVARPGTAGC